MPDESEVIQADVAVEFPLPNGKHVLAKPVPYPAARKILALIHAFDQTYDYETTIQPAIDQFCAVTGISDDEVMALCPDMSLGDLVVAMQRFFFRRRPISVSGAAPSKPAELATGA